jgi:hypothetical protein
MSLSEGEDDKTKEDGRMRRGKVTYKGEYGLHHGLVRPAIDGEILFLREQSGQFTAHVLASLRTSSRSKRNCLGTT